MTPDELVAHAVGNGGEVEVPFFVAEFGVKDNLEEKITELLFDVVDQRIVRPTVGRRTIERFERVDRLIGLFEQMTGQRGVRLLLIPWTLRAQALHELDEIIHRFASVAQPVHPERRQVIGSAERRELFRVERS